MSRSAQIVSAFPMVYNLGIDDSSRLPNVYEAAKEGIHQPMCFLYTQWGPEEPLVIDGGSLSYVYGDETLNLRGVYANHATVFADIFAREANTLVVKRIVPDDAGPKATLRIWIDVLETSFKEIEREIDGSFKKNVSNEYVTTATDVPGCKVKFFVEPVNDDFGKAAIKTGTMTESSATSKMIPLLDFEAPFKGEYGNRFGLRIWAPTTRDVIPLNESILSKDGCYPFRIMMVRKPNKLASSKVVETNYAEKFDTFVLKPNMVDTDYNKERSLQVVALDNYSDLKNINGMPPKYGPIGSLGVYQDNIEYVLKLFLDKERSLSYSGNTLFNKDKETDYNLVNIFGLQQPDGKPYQSIRFDMDSSDGVRFNEHTDHFLSGASDGTMSNELFDAAVGVELDNFADPNHWYQNMTDVPCTCLWDSGFGLQTKYKLGKFEAQRYDTMVVPCTMVAGERPLTNSEESTRVIAIVERMRAYGTSPEFGTPNSRCGVVAHSGDLISSSWRQRVPTSYELAVMIAKFAGGSVLDMSELPDRGTKNEFKYITNINNPWKPVNVRNRDYMAGMIYPEKKTINKYAFLSLHTIYDDDTSVLTSFINNIIIMSLQRVMYFCHKEHAGSTRTQGELKEDVEDYMLKHTSGKYGSYGKYDFTCFTSDADNKRGFSWSLRTDAYLPRSTTVQTCWVNAHGIEAAANVRTAFYA